MTLDDYADALRGRLPTARELIGLAEEMGCVVIRSRGRVIVEPGEDSSAEAAIIQKLLHRNPWRTWLESER